MQIVVKVCNCITRFLLEAEGILHTIGVDLT